MATYVKTPITNIKPVQTASAKSDWLNAILAGRKFIGEYSPERAASEKLAADLGLSAAGYMTRVNEITLALGAGTVQTTLAPTVAQALIPFSAAVAAKATVLTDLPSGNLVLPRYETGVTVTTYTDSAATTAVNPTFSVLVLSPARYGVQVGFTRQLLTQAATKPSLKANVAAQILRGIGAAVDKAALNAILAAPTGTANLGNVSEIAFGGAATWGKLVAAKQAVLGANVVNDGSFAWIIDSATYGKWNTIAKVATFPEFLIDEDGTCLQAPVFVTENLAPSHKAIFCRASDIVIAVWATEIITDEMSGAANGVVYLHVNVLASAGVLRGPSFCRSSDSAAQ
jgi:HK97 family phage major capsid protein